MIRVQRDPHVFGGHYKGLIVSFKKFKDMLIGKFCNIGLDPTSLNSVFVRGISN